MADEVTKVVLDLDNAEFVEKMQDSLGLIGQLGNSEGLQGLVEGLTTIGAIAGVLGVAFLGIKTALDLTVEAEHIQQLNNSFQMLAANAGLAGDALKDKLVTAAGGLVSETELLGAANKAIVQMGDNAGKIPEIMELARKYTAGFGGDLITNFEQMSKAMQMGNTRMLAHFGIVVDATHAHQEYAKSLGSSTEFLSQAGQKQAIFNVALEQAKAKFGGIDESAIKTTNALKSIGVAFTEIKEMAALAWNAMAGDAVSHAVTNVSDLIHGYATQMKAWFGTGKEQADATKESLERQSAQYKMLISQTNQAFNPGQYAGYVNALKVVELELEKVNKQTERSEELAQHKAQASGPKTNDAAAMAEAEKARSLDHEKILKEKTKFEGDLLKIKQAAEKDEEKSITSLAEFQKLRDQEIITSAKEASQKMNDLRVNALAKGLITEQQYAQAVANIQKKMNSDITQIRQKSYADEVTAMKNLEAQNEKTATGFSAAWHKNGAQASRDFEDMSKFGENTFKAVGSNATSAFKAIGDGSKNAADALKGAMFGALGSIAETEGEYLLLAGIGTYDPVKIAEGAALIAFGSAVSAMGTGGSKVSSSGGGSSGGGSSAAPATQASASTSPSPVAAQSKSLTVAISGNIFETDQTRTRLMDMIRQAGDFTDFNLKQIGQS
jgi:hypothetical protein